jgi:hypothetical protein
MGQCLSNLAPWEICLIAAPAIMLGATLFFGGVILLLESPKREADDTPWIRLRTKARLVLQSRA